MDSTFDGVSTTAKTEVKSTATILDTDGDGIIDDEDRFLNASVIVDSDNDELFDSEEENAGLDPLNPKTFVL